MEQRAKGPPPMEVRAQIQWEDPKIQNDETEVNA